MDNRLGQRTPQLSAPAPTEQPPQSVQNAVRAPCALLVSLPDPSRAQYQFIGLAPKDPKKVGFGLINVFHAASPPSEVAVPLDQELPGGASVNLHLQLLEKPRGSLGQWIPLEPGQHVRVSSKKGKNLRLLARLVTAAGHAIPPVAWETANVYSIELSAAGVQRKFESKDPAAQFQVLSARPTSPTSTCEFDLKVFFKNNTVHFAMELPELGIRGVSGSIIAHNSGHIDQQNASRAKPQTQANRIRFVTPRDNDSDYGYDQIPSPGLDECVRAESPSGTISSPSGHSAHDSNSPPWSPNLALPDAVTSPGGTDWITIEQSGLDVQGLLRSQRFLQYSDLLLKTDIADIVDALHFVTQLSGKRYRWKPPFDENQLVTTASDRRQYVLGFLAQEVQRVLPELVEQVDASGFLTVKYSEFVPLLIEALKQQSREVDAWTERVQSISSEFERSHRILLNDLRTFSSTIALRRGSSSTSTTSTSASSSDEERQHFLDSQSVSAPAQSVAIPNKKSYGRGLVTSPSSSSVGSKKRGSQKRPAKPIMVNYNEPESYEEDSYSSSSSSEEPVKGAIASERPIRAEPSKLDVAHVYPYDPPVSPRTSAVQVDVVLSTSTQRVVVAEHPPPLPAKPPRRKSVIARKAAAAVSSATESRVRIVLLSVSLVLLVGCGVFLGVFFGLKTAPSPPPPPTVQEPWQFRNIADNPGFEDGNPTDPTTATSWFGTYTRVPYDYTGTKRLTNPWPLMANASLYFNAGKWGARMSVARPVTNELPPAATAAQIVNMTRLGLEITNGVVDQNTGLPDASSLVCGMNVTLWYNWIYLVPLNETNPVLWNTNWSMSFIPKPAITLELIASAQVDGVSNKTLWLNSTIVEANILDPYNTPWDWHQLKATLPIAPFSWPHSFGVFFNSTVSGDIFFDLVEVKLDRCPTPIAPTNPPVGLI